MLPAGLAVHDEAQVLEEEASLGRFVDSDLPACFGHPLPLVSTWLRVLLDLDGAPARHLPHFHECGLRSGHFICPRGVTSRDVVARAEPAWADHLASLDEFCGWKHVLAIHRGIERRRHAVREIDRLFEVVLRTHPAPLPV